MMNATFPQTTVTINVRDTEKARKTAGVALKALQKVLQADLVNGLVSSLDKLNPNLRRSDLGCTTPPLSEFGLKAELSLSSISQGDGTFLGYVQLSVTSTSQDVRKTYAEFYFTAVGADGEDAYRRLRERVAKLQDV